MYVFKICCYVSLIGFYMYVIGCQVLAPALSEKDRIHRVMCTCSSADVKAIISFIVTKIQKLYVYNVPRCHGNLVLLHLDMFYLNKSTILSFRTCLIFAHFITDFYLLPFQTSCNFVGSCIMNTMQGLTLQVQSDVDDHIRQ